MEIMIAILWYLQLIMPGGTYHQDQINTICNDNKTVIQSVQNNADMTNAAVTSYSQFTSGGGQVYIPDPWEDPWYPKR